jgi:predicted nucleic acid-binding protein
LKLVVDSSVAIKWFANESDSGEADLLRQAFELVAPDLLVSECTNAFWKKSRRGEMTAEDVLMSCQGLSCAGLVYAATDRLAASAGAMAIAFDHPAYDCFYLALAAERAAPFVTADLSLVRKLRAANFSEARVLTLAEAATLAA